MFKRLIAGSILAFTVMVGFTTPAFATTEPPSPIIDTADLFTTAEENQLQQVFADHKETANLIYVVETLETINGQNPETFAINRANELQVGDKTNNGIYILILSEDRKVRIEPGTGAKKHLPSYLIQHVINTTTTPSYANKNYYQGTVNTTDQLTETYIKNSTAPPPTPEDAAWVYWLLGVVVTTLIVCILFFGAMWIKDRKVQQARVAENLRRHERIKIERATRDKMKASLFRNAPNKKAREQLILDIIENYAKKDPEYVDTLVERVYRWQREDILNEALYANMPRSWFQVKWTEDDEEANMSLQEYLNSSAFRNLRIATKRKVKERAKAEQEKEKQKEQDLKKAKTIWKKLSPHEQAQIRKAPTRKKAELLQQYTSQGDFASWSALVPAIIVYYSSLGGFGGGSSSSSASSSSSSSSSRSSSSSSYDSSSSYSSFSGGSFDGGGGGGSW